MPGSREDGEMAERRSRMEKLERLGEKIEKLEAELEKPDISSKRREKLKKKLDKLFAKRDRLLPDGGSPPVLSPGGGMPSGGAVFTCPMGHDAGVATKDGRCPRCGMALERARSHGASGGYEAPRSSGTACGGRADAGSDACRTP
ncbi:MAG: hypothetical protein HY927_08890 [Elusimicrobia bacterium]|nr:hypothetical protein [Elusimicrobiota bacterium]